MRECCSLIQTNRKKARIIMSMRPRLLSFRSRALFGLAVPILSILLAAPARAEAPAPIETLPPGESRERPIAAGETHFWRVVVAPGTNLLVTVEQQSIDLVVEARGPEGHKPIAV